MKIEKTTDYNQFKLLDLNRAKIDNLHVSKLVASIKARNLLDKRPILVNANMEVIDGQHRLAAARLVGVPIYYQIDEGLEVEDIAILNSNQKNWKVEDWLNYYVKLGSKPYISFNKFIIDNGMNVYQGLAFAGYYKKQGATKGFCEGKLMYDDKFSGPFCKMMQEMLRHIEEQIGLKRFIKTSRFLKALSSFMKLDGVDPEVFKHKITVQSFKITLQRDYCDYVRVFVEIYNYRNSEKVLMDG